MRRPSIAWFSPLPPLHTEIGNHTARIAPALARHAEVTLWTTQAEWDPALEDVCAVRRWDPDRPDWPALNAADVGIYNIGNSSTFHADILRLSQTVPGVVILHDTRLQHLCRLSLPRAAYADAMQRFYGEAGAAAVEALEAGRTTETELAGRLPLDVLATEQALAVILHNPADAAFVREGTPAPVEVLPLPFRPAPQAPAPARGPDDRLRLILFGFIGRNRRIDSVLDALQALPAEERRAFRLDVYGVPWDEAALRRMIADRALHDTVTLHGYVPEAELDAAIHAADMAFNLRWPSMGEASASQLRLWSAACPTLVTNTGWYATLPRDTVIPVSPDVEAATIAWHLRMLKADPAPYRAVGEAGRRWLAEHHDPDAYAAGIVAVAERAAMAPHATARLVGERLGRALAALPEGARTAIDINHTARTLSRPWSDQGPATQP